MNNHNSSYKYVIAASCFGIQAIGIGTYVCYGVFFNSLVSEFGWSRAAISGASSLAFFLMGLFGILVGRISDRIGPRNVMAITGLLFGLGHVLMSRLGAVWQLYVFYGVVVGIGMSSIDVIPLSEAIRTRQFWMICSVNLSILFCLMTIIVHIIPHARDIGISAARSASVLATIGGVSMVGRFFVGIAIDRIGSKRTMVIACILLIGGLLWLQTAKELWVLYLFAVIYGTAHGGFFTAISPIVAEFFGIRAHGVLFGIIAFCGTVGGALGPILAGHIFDVTAHYNPAFWLCTVMGILGLVLLLLLKPIEDKGLRNQQLAR
jgi:MFS family permease